MTFQAPFYLVLAVPVCVGLVLVWRRTFVSFARPQMWLMLGLRAALVLCLFGALARPELPLRARHLALGFAVDTSGSVAPDRVAAAARVIESVRRAVGPDVSTRVVTFAGEPHLVGAEGALEPAGDPGRTDIARALYYTAELLPDRQARRIILLSDGRQSTGDARAAARALGASGVDVNPVVLPPSTGIECAVRDLVMPPTLRRGLEATVTAMVACASPARVRLELTENGVAVDSREIDVRRGIAPVRVPLVPQATGLARYGVVVHTPGDLIPANDHFERLVEVSGDPRVLLVDSDALQAIPLSDALRAQGVDVELRSADGLPSSLEELSGYDAVVLSEVAPATMSRLAQSALETYVRDLGGGLVVVAGPTGLKGPGGTPMARVMPVELDGGSERQVPPVAMVLVIDRSGSMVGQKLEFAKNAALAAVDALPDTAKLGLIAFDADYTWIAPVQPLTDRDNLKQQIQNIGTGGGTRFYPALKDAFYTLRSIEAGTRHIVLLTDGLSTDGDDFDALTAKMRAGAVTLSTVAISREADQKLLKSLADHGGGRYHYTERASDVPRIFVDEAKTAISTALAEHSFAPTLVQASEEVLGLSLDAAPRLGGHVTTRAKLSSEVVLSAPNRDPLLVRWRYGLGRVEVFTSDAKARWSQAWISWPGYNKLWGQVLHAAMRTRPREDLVTRLQRRGDDVHILVDAITDEGQLLDANDVRALVVDANRVQHRAELQRTGPGLFEADLRLPPSGSTLVQPVVTTGGRPLVGHAGILDEPYPPEYLGEGDDTTLLRAVAEESGGRYNAPLDELARLDRGTAPRRRTTGWPLLAGLTLLLFIGDLVLKRVRLGGRS